MRSSFIACVVLSALGAAQAEEHTSESYSACLGKAGGVTSAMQECIKEELERQERSLNAAYQVARYISVFGTYTFYRQRNESSSANAADVDQNRVFIGLQFGYPFSFD